MYQEQQVRILAINIITNYFYSKDYAMFLLNLLELSDLDIMNRCYIINVMFYLQ